MSLETPAAPPATPATPAASPANPTNPGAPVINYHIGAPAQAAGPPAPAATAQPAAPAGTSPPAPTAATPASPPVIPLTADQFQHLVAAQAELARRQAEDEANRIAREREQAEARTRQGQLEEGLQLLRQQSEQQLQAERQRLQQVEDRAKRYALDGEIERALGSYSFASPNARRTFADSIRNQFVVDMQGDTLTVRTPTFQTVGDLVGQVLSHADNAYLLAPRGNPAGGTQPNAAAPAPVNPAAQQQPIPEGMPQYRNAGEALVAHIKAEQARLAANPAAGYVPNRPIGLLPVA